MAVASGSLRRCWRPAAALHRAAHTGRAEPLRAEDLAERLRARKSEEEKREVSDEPGPWGGMGAHYNSRHAPRPFPARLAPHTWRTRGAGPWSRAGLGPGAVTCGFFLPDEHLGWNLRDLCGGRTGWGLGDVVPGVMALSKAPQHPPEHRSRSPC